MLLLPKNFPNVGASGVALLGPHHICSKGTVVSLGLFQMNKKEKRVITAAVQPKTNIIKLCLDDNRFALIYHVYLS